MSEVRATEADRLLAEPVTIEHPSGRRVGLLFTNRAVVEIERQFGSMGQFSDELLAILVEGHHAPVLTFIVKALDAVLWDDPPAIRENRADCLELTKLGAYFQAIREAWNRLWRQAGVQLEDVDPNPDGA